MINTQSINSFQLNALPANSMFQEGAVLDDMIGFNGLGLHNEEIYITETDDENGTDQELRSDGFPTDVGRQIIIQRDDSKIINLNGVICYDSGSTEEEKKENFLKYIDEFKRKLFVDSGWLDIKTGSIVRRYKATLTNRASIFGMTGKQINYREFSLQFQVLDAEPFAQDVGYTGISKFDADLMNYFVDAISEGTASSKLVAILVVKEATSISQIVLKNNTDETSLKLTADVEAGDVVVFDCKSREISVNGSKKKPRGTWIDVLSGTNSIEIESTGDSILYDLTLKWKQSFN